MNFFDNPLLGVIVVKNEKKIMTDSENESQENVSIKDKKKYIKNEKKNYD
jgi:hypothetical protein